MNKAQRAVRGAGTGTVARRARVRTARLWLVAAGAAGMLTLAGCASTGAQNGAEGDSSSAAAPATSPAVSASTVAVQPSQTPAGGLTVTATPAAPTTHASSSPAASPVLGGLWAPGITGYGTVRPGEINNNGDPTGIVQSLTWSSWGGATATGTGTSEYVADGQSVAQGTEQTATVVAFGLGTCDGKPAYLKLEWYFAGEGQSFASGSYLNACTGDHVGGF